MVPSVVARARPIKVVSHAVSMNWQNQFPEGAISDSQVMIVFATLLDVAGIPLPKMNGKNPMRGMKISHMKSGGQDGDPRHFHELMLGLSSHTQV